MFSKCTSGKTCARMVAGDKNRQQPMRRKYQQNVRKSHTRLSVWRELKRIGTCNGISAGYKKEQSGCECTTSLNLIWADISQKYTFLLANTSESKCVYRLGFMFRLCTIGLPVLIIFLPLVSRRPFLFLQRYSRAPLRGDFLHYTKYSDSFLKQHYVFSIEYTLHTAWAYKCRLLL